MSNLGSTAEHATEVRAQLWAHNLEMACVEDRPISAPSLITILTFEMQYVEQASRPHYLYTLAQGLGGDRHVLSYACRLSLCHLQTTVLQTSSYSLQAQFHEGAFLEADAGATLCAPSGTH